MRFALALACICTLFASRLGSTACAAVIINPTNMQAAGEFNDPGNSTMTFLLMPGATINAISWDNLAYTAYAPSRVNELVFSFTDSTGLNYWDFTVSSLSTPGNFLGSGNESNIVVNDSSSGIKSLTLQADGILNFTIYDVFDDTSIPINALVTGGTFTIAGPGVVAVPEPSSMALMGCIFTSGMVVRRWRKRSSVS